MFSCTILIGLPGSGKTTYTLNYNQFIFNSDNFKGTLQDLAIYCNTLNKDFILDGLFLTQKTQQYLYNNLNYNIKFVYFIENRQQCILNDQKRNRIKSSKQIILNAPLDDPAIWLNINKINYEKVYIQ